MLRKFFLSLLLLVFLLSSCNLTPSSTFVNLYVSRIENSASSCALGLQAKLTLLSDQAVIESPKLLNANEVFEENNGLQYPQKTRVRLEAHCFEENGDEGLLIVEGTIQPPFKQNPYRSVSVYFPNLINSGCINPQNTESRDITVIDYQEPAPCVSPDTFTFPL